ncbi:ABC transporter permease [Alteromonas sp. H39]|uniref:ABC transporter permease n=1 Tax=Alteromonas sp. H39 TaxID=3389876 RepID=UPI0039E07D8B
MITQIAIASLRHRLGSVLLTLFTIVISVSLLLSVEYVRGQVRDSFTRTVSGVDIIVGAPTGQLNLLLYSVFRLGNPTNGVDWEDVAWLKTHPQVDWVVPLSLGDAHKGFRVVGTTNAYFEHFKYGDKQALSFAAGEQFLADTSAVIGAEVAAELGYKVSDNIVVSHGLGDVSFQHHDAHPFTITGILAPTGTPADKAVYVTLHGIESVHASPSPRQSLRRTAISKPTSDKVSEQTDVSASQANQHHDHDHHDEHEDTDAQQSHNEEHSADEHSNAKTMLSQAPPESVSALLLGLKSRVAALQLQHQINNYDRAALLAILPGVALKELWGLMGNVEKLLLGISVLILLSSLIGLVTLLLATMRERRQEIAVLRAIGAGPATILWLVQAEALLISLVGCVLSIILVSLGLSIFSEWLNASYGLIVTGSLFTQATGIVIACVMAATWLCSFIPAVAAYRTALHTGLSGR